MRTGIRIAMVLTLGAALASCSPTDPAYGEWKHLNGVGNLPGSVIVISRDSFAVDGEAQPVRKDDKGGFLYTRTNLFGEKLEFKFEVIGPTCAKCYSVDSSGQVNGVIFNFTKTSK